MARVQGIPYSSLALPLKLSLQRIRQGETDDEPQRSIPFGHHVNSEGPIVDGLSLKPDGLCLHFRFNQAKLEQALANPIPLPLRFHVDRGMGQRGHNFFRKSKATRVE